MTAAGGLSILVLATGPAQATFPSAGGALDSATTARLTGEASASLAVMAKAKANARADVRVLGATGSVLASGKVHVAADARVTASYDLDAAAGAAASARVTPWGDGCVAVVVSATSAVTGVVTARVDSAGTTTMLRAAVSTSGPGEVASTVVCAEVDASIG